MRRVLSLLSLSVRTLFSISLSPVLSRLPPRVPLRLLMLRARRAIQHRRRVSEHQRPICLCFTLSVSHTLDCCAPFPMLTPSTLPYCFPLPVVLKIILYDFLFEAIYIRAFPLTAIWGPSGAL